MDVWIDARAQGWAKHHAAPGGGWRMFEKFQTVRHDQPPYSTRYPGLADILESDPAAPLSSVVELNVFISVGKWLALHGAKEQEVRLNNNLHNLDTPYDANQPIDVIRSLDLQAPKNIGFEPISVERVGPRRPDR